MTTSTPAVLLPLRSRKFDQGGTNGLHWIGCAMMIPDDTVRLSMQISGSTRSGARFGSSRSPLARSGACLCLCVRNESLLFARRRPPTTNYRLLAALTSRVRLGPRSPSKCCGSVGPRIAGGCRALLGLWRRSEDVIMRMAWDRSARVVRVVMLS